MPPKKTKTKRYNLALPEKLYDELGQVAEQRGVTIVELLRSFIKLGLLVIKLEDKDDTSFLIRENGVDREVIILSP